MVGETPERVPTPAEVAASEAAAVAAASTGQPAYGAPTAPIPTASGQPAYGAPTAPIPTASGQPAYGAPTAPIPAIGATVPGTHLPPVGGVASPGVEQQQGNVPAGTVMATPLAIPHHPGVDSPEDQIKQAIMCAVAGSVCLLIGFVWPFALLGSGAAYLLGIVLAGQGRSTLLAHGHPTERATTALWANWIGIIAIPLVFLIYFLLFGLLLAGVI